jgi:serine/threonine protein kinase
MHRDIKPENFLINGNSTTDASSENTMGIKLADFGLAKDFKKSRGGAHTEYVATRWYRAPELVLRQPTYDQSVDMFALGCIMAELYLGRPLFPGVSEADQLTRIVTILGTPSQQDWPEGHRVA